MAGKTWKASMIVTTHMIHSTVDSTSTDGRRPATSATTTPTQATTHATTFTAVSAMSNGLSSGTKCHPDIIIFVSRRLSKL